MVSFGAVMAIRRLNIGSVVPAGTGGTQVTETYSLSEAIGYALSQVAYIFGCNAGPEHLDGTQLKMPADRGVLQRRLDG